MLNLLALALFLGLLILLSTMWWLLIPILFVAIVATVFAIIYGFASGHYGKGSPAASDPPPNIDSLSDPGPWGPS